MAKKEPTTGDQPEAVEPFSAGQIALIDKMFQERIQAVKGAVDGSSSPNSAISMYNLRDPKSIETVKVSRFDAKWVLGFKNLQNDPYKKTPKYLRYGIEPIRKLHNEPYVTLILSKDGVNMEEKEILHVDYMENREVKDMKVIHIEVKEIIHDHGILGASSQFAVAVNDKGNPEARPTILAQSKSVERKFTVNLPVFDEAGNETGAFEHVFITDFLG